MEKILEEKNIEEIKNIDYFKNVKDQINTLTFKITKYEEATLKLENQNTTINVLQMEIQKLKEEAKQETTLLINSRIRQLTTEEEKNVDISFQNEYNVFLKIKGVEELDKKIKRNNNLKPKNML